MLTLDHFTTSFTANTGAKLGVCFGRRTPLPIGLNLEEFEPKYPEDN